MRPIEFEILLILAAGERHGYALMQAIESARADGSTVETGTLYRALQRLLEQDFVRQETPARQIAGTEDERRRYYAITPAGRRAARQEAQRMATLVDGARTARLL